MSPETSSSLGVGQDDEGPLLLQGGQARLPRPEVGHVDTPARQREREKVKNTVYSVRSLGFNQTLTQYSIPYLYYTCKSYEQNV